MKSKLAVFIIGILCTYILFNRIDEWRNTTFQWDKQGYHSYLPAIFIYNDLKGLSFYPAICEKYHFTGDDPWYAAYQQPNGNRVNKYPVGPALLELPFFLAANVSVSIFAPQLNDGFSVPYQLTVALNDIFWVMVGLFFLRGFLRRYFTDNITAVTIICIALGTNLYNYTAFDHGMSHPISFSLFAALLFFTERFYDTCRNKYLLAIAVVLGLITITRPTNCIAAIIPLLWNIRTKKDLVNRFSFFSERYKACISAIIVFFLVLLPQLAYWKYATGHWIYYSYEGEGFNFAHPKIWKGLFGWQKGWFIYTPIAFLAILGLFQTAKKHKQFLLSFTLFLPVIIYVTFSWKNWWYGGGFGCRPLIDILPVMALPLATLIEFFYERKQFFTKSIFSMMLLFFISLNLFQVYQFSKGVIHYERMSRAYYFKIFGKTAVDHAAYDKYLMSEEEYYQNVNAIWK